jgi:hypothetical protein
MALCRFKDKCRLSSAWQTMQFGMDGFFKTWQYTDAQPLEWPIQRDEQNAVLEYLPVSKEQRNWL